MASAVERLEREFACYSEDSASSQEHLRPKVDLHRSYLERSVKVGKVERRIERSKSGYELGADGFVV